VPCDRSAAVNAVPEDRGRRELVTESDLVFAHPRKISAVRYVLVVDRTIG
jgi:hypothetical protein